MLKALFPYPSSNPYLRSSETESPQAVWFQPGAESEEIKQFVNDRGIGDRVVLGGPCILVMGEGLLATYRKEEGRM